MKLKRRNIGWILIVIFGGNLIYSLSLTMSEPFSEHGLAVFVSIIFLLYGFHLTRSKKTKVIDKREVMK